MSAPRLLVSRCGHCGMLADSPTFSLRCSNDGAHKWIGEEDPAPVATVAPDRGYDDAVRTAREHHDSAHRLSPEHIAAEFGQAHADRASLLTVIAHIGADFDQAIHYVETERDEARREAAAATERAAAAATHAARWKAAAGLLWQHARAWKRALEAERTSHERLIDVVSQVSAAAGLTATATPEERVRAMGARVATLDSLLEQRDMYRGAAEALLAETGCPSFPVLALYFKDGQKQRERADAAIAVLRAIEWSCIERGRGTCPKCHGFDSGRGNGHINGCELAAALRALSANAAPAGGDHSTGGGGDGGGEKR